jgi:DNA-binding transcriptional LysR family regulator
MTVELRQMRHVIALAEHGTLGRAAVALGMTQPALTRSLKVLEHQVGATLFERSKAGVAPTDEGRLLVQRAREVVQLADRFEHDLVRSRPAGSAQVVVGAGAYAAETVLQAALARFVDARPLAQVRVVVRDWDELVRRLRAREVDAFVAERSTLVADHDLEVEALARHPLYFVARPGHPLAARERVRTADVLGFPVLMPSRIPPRVLHQVNAARVERGARSVRAFPAVEFDNLAAVARMVGESDAVAALTLPFVADDVRRGRLVVLGSEPWLYLEYGLVTSRGRTPTAAARELFDRLREADAALVERESRLIGRRTGPARNGRQAPVGDASATPAA